MKTVELRRHTEADGDALTAEGVRAALALGTGLVGGYEVVVTSGAQRATQTAACFLAGLGQRVPGGVVVDEGFRSEQEDRWRAAAARAEGKTVEAFLAADPELAEADVARFAEALRRAFDRLPEGGIALVVGHSPMSEAAVYGLTGTVVDPLAKGAGVAVTAEAGRFQIEPLP